MSKAIHKRENKRCLGCGVVKSIEIRRENCSNACEQRSRSKRAPLTDEKFEKVVVKFFDKKRGDGSGGKLSLELLCSELDRSPQAINAAVESLVNQGKNFQVDGDAFRYSIDVPVTQRHEATQIIHPAKNWNGGWRKFGACGDFHFGSRHERIDVANALYDRYAEEGVTEVFHTGNWIEGEAGTMNFADINVFGLDDQMEHCLDVWPQREGIKTYFVAGDDHEGWYQKKTRLIIGKHLERMARERGREDLIYIGYQEGHVELKTKSGGVAHMIVMHPGGGSAYATSYAPQKIAEAFQEGEKPDVCVLGHYHKMDYGYHRGIHMVQTGTCQDQSSFMRKQKIKAHVGGALIELHQAPEGYVNRFKPEFFTFFDRGFYGDKKRKFLGN